MTDYSGLSDPVKRESILYMLLREDALSRTTQNEIMDWVHSQDHIFDPDKLSDEARGDIGGALALAALCEWEVGISEFALAGADIGHEKFKSSLCGIIADGIRKGVPLDLVKMILVKSYEEQIIDKMANNN
jgi:hypothetical protein